MDEHRVSMFVSHKVASHRQAALKIRDILQSRTERLDVHICEDIQAGNVFREWINRSIAEANLMLVILPRTDSDLQWIATEIGKFQAIAPRGRLIALKHRSDEIPDIIRDRQVIDAIKELIAEKFLEPLYRQGEFTGSGRPLNTRVSNADIARDAQEIEDAIACVLPMRSEFCASLVVETPRLCAATGVDEARVTAFYGFGEILDWQRQSFSWRELRERAAQDRGKGTFWVSEMEQVMIGAAQQDSPRIMSSTLRGRGNKAGLIFRPALDHVDYIVDKPVRFQFAFHEVLVPELVRTRGALGDIFNLLYVATRVRSEVLYPFLIKPWIENDGPPSKWEMSKEEREDLIGKVIGSLRVIDLQIERHNMLEAVSSAFDGDDRQLIARMMRERQSIKMAIETAGRQSDLEKLMCDLKQALDMNCRVIGLLAAKFQQLVSEETVDIKEMLQQHSGAPASAERGQHRDGRQR